jgi:cytochrome c oxidase subunit II
MGRNLGFILLGVLALALPLTFLLPPGPPDAVTSSGETINDVYWVVMAASAVVFVLIEGALLLFIFRFGRQPGTPEDVEGPQVHGNTRLEVIWTLIPAIALAAIAIFVLVKTPAVQAVSDARAMRISVEAHQFYWQYEYENGVVALDRLRIPVDTAITLELQTLDVEHSWWTPDLTGKLDLVPGRTNRLHFTANRTGSLDGACAELCGVQHALMDTEVEVLEKEEFDAWLADQEQAQAGEATELGQSTFEAVCGKCHGLAGEGGVGPRIAGSPQLTNPDSMRTLLREGQDTDAFASYMPPNLAAGWPDRQFEALIAYFRTTRSLEGGEG